MVLTYEYLYLARELSKNEDVNFVIYVRIINYRWEFSQITERLINTYKIKSIVENRTNPNSV
jgi:hypothetical protein